MIRLGGLPLPGRRASQLLPDRLPVPLLDEPPQRSQLDVGFLRAAQLERLPARRRARLEPADEVSQRPRHGLGGRLGLERTLVGVGARSVSLHSWTVTRRSEVRRVIASARFG